MSAFRLSITQADKNDTSLLPEGGRWVPLERSERPKTPFELLNCGEREGITVRSYVLMLKSLNGELAERFRKSQSKPSEPSVGPQG